ncbi:MAG: hypothetical protein R2710_06510 [Acidimicrobiales bacterium]
MKVLLHPNWRSSTTAYCPYPWMKNTAWSACTMAPTPTTRQP